MMTECDSGLFVGVSGHEILLAVAVFFVLAAQNVAGTGGSGEGWILSRLGGKGRERV